MGEFLPNGSLYIFIGMISVLFSLMTGCFLYYKGRTYFKGPLCKRKKKENDNRGTVRRKTARNKFLMKRGERADKDEEGGAVEIEMDKIKADIDAKYNQQIVWSTVESGEPNAIYADVEED